MATNRKVQKRPKGPTYNSILVRRKLSKKTSAIIISVFAIVSVYILFRSFAATSLTGADGEFTPIGTTRILNTTNNTGLTGPVTPGATVKIKVAGVGGVPSANVRAVDINISVISPTTNGYTTLWPSGAAMPSTSNINFINGKHTSSHAIVQVGSDGYIQLYNSNGTNHYVAEVTGYYSTASGNRGTRFTPTTPTRILHTIDKLGYNAPLAGGQTIDVQVAGRGPVPSTGVSAVVMNVIALPQNYDGYLTIWPKGSPQPFASNVNYKYPQNRGTLVTAKLGTNGQVSLFSSAGNTHVIFEVLGYYGTTSSSSNQTGRFVPINQSRILDTSTGVGGYSRLINSGETISVKATGLGAIPANDVQAVALNIAAVPTTTSPGYLTVFPNGDQQPYISQVNYSNGENFSNQVISAVKPGGYISIYNAGAPVRIIVDVNGFFANDAVTIPARFPGDPNPKLSGKAYWGSAYESNGDVKTRYENTAGKSLSVHRTYWAWDKAATEMVTTAKADIAANRLPFVSTKTPSWAAMGAGQYDAAIDTILRNLDAAGGPIWLTLWHEPEDNSTGTAPNEKCERDPVKYGACLGTPADWRAMQSRVKNRMTALGIKNVALMPTLMSWTFDPASGRNPEDWWVPGIWSAYMVDHYCDYNCINAGYGPQTAPSWTRFVAWAEAKNIPFGIGEWGSRGTDTVAAQRMQNYWEWAFQNGKDMIAFTYYDSSLNSDTGAWTLTSEPYSKFIDILKNDTRVKRLR